MDMYRVNGVLDLKMVQNTSVMFVGLGSLGSLALSNLVFPWKKVVLADLDTLEKHNIERHLLGRSGLGLPKVEGVKKWLVDKGLDQKSIVAHNGPVQELFASGEHDDVNLVFVNVDNNTAKMDTHAWCYTNKIPAVYGGVYPLGTGGDIFVVPGNNLVCYECINSFMGGDAASKAAKDERATDYGLNAEQLLADDGSVKAVPALHMAVNSIAVEMATLGMDLLTNQITTAHVYIKAHAWEKIFRLSPGDKLNAITSYIGFQYSMNMTPSYKITRADNVFEIWMQRGIISIAIPRSTACTRHSDVIDAGNI